MREETIIEAINDIDSIRCAVEDMHAEITNTPDYWTRLEHQYAGMAMQGMLSNEYTHKLYLDNKNYPIGLLNDSIMIAHALVEKMKNLEHEKNPHTKADKATSL